MDSRKAGDGISSESEGLRTRGVDGADFSPKAGEDEVTCHSSHTVRSERTEAHSWFSSAFLCHSHPQLIRRGPPTSGRAIYFTQSAHPNANLNQEHAEIIFNLGIPWPSHHDTQNWPHTHTASST